jgi:3-carboxy-cis,cis-muconate cycloisomerase
MSSLWDPVFGAGRVAAEVDDAAWVRAMLEAEAALTRACASVGLVPAEAAHAVTAACADAGWVPVGELGRQAAAGGNPVIPLVRLLRARVGEATDAVHLGATSQDILDTAAMLVARRSLDVIVDDLVHAAGAAADLARVHRDTVTVARTLLQQALPTTFGATAAWWGAGLDRAVAGLRAIQPAAQLGGAAGTLAALHPHGLAVQAAFARELGLAQPAEIWHAERTRTGELAGALATASGAIGKVATDVVLLAQTEIGELRESAGGGSSALPHKQNPIAAVTARAAAAQAPGLAATLFAAMAGEHQRAAGAWHAEWPALASLLRSTGGAAARLRQCLDGLRVDREAMRRNLDLTSGLILAERIVTELAPSVGRSAARDAVERAAGKDDMVNALLADPTVNGHLDAERLAGLLDPSAYLGHAGDLVDRYLQGRGA